MGRVSIYIESNPVLLDYKIDDSALGKKLVVFTDRQDLLRLNITKKLILKFTATAGQEKYLAFFRISLGFNG